MQIAVASRAHRVTEPRPGHVEHDAERMWWEEVCETLREIANRHPQEARNAQAIGISAIGASIVPVDENGHALRPAILYGVDRRSLPQIAALEQALGADEICSRTGRLLSSQSVGPKILWIKENEPDIHDRTRQYLPPIAFVSKRLCDVSAIDLHTALSFDPLFLPHEKQWDLNAVSLICRSGQLPEVHAAGTPIGRLDGNVAASLGLPAGIPVCCGTADVLAEGLAAGAIYAGDTMIMYGSTIFIVHVTDTFLPRPPYWASFYPIGGLYCQVTGTATAGAAAQWFLDIAAGESASEREKVQRLVADARAAADGLIFLPYLRGERAPIFDPSARGVFFGLNARHGAKEMYRAVIESLGFSLRHALETMKPASQRLLMSGGGSDLGAPLQIAVNASGFPQQRTRRGRNASYGAAVLAGLGVELLRTSDLDEAFFGGIDEMLPSSSDSRDYATGFALYRRVAEMSAELFKSREFEVFR